MKHAHKIPRLPASARKAGAIRVDRCLGGSVFAVSFRLDDAAGWTDPGHGTDVVATLRAHFVPLGWRVDWTGNQSQAIHLHPPVNDYAHHENSI